MAISSLIAFAPSSFPAAVSESRVVPKPAK